MIYNIAVPVGEVSDMTTYILDMGNCMPQFPILKIDRGSYIVGAQIQSGINFDVDLGVHSIQIGKYGSIAESVTFIIDLNHSYHNIAQGELDFFTLSKEKLKLKRKGEVIIQNDVWIGHGATILGGVTIHNGAVIAANSVVTKDVPPYAIVGGNPAKILGRYRFSDEQIQALLSIAWWNWEHSKLKYYARDFGEEIEVFISRHLKREEKELSLVEPLMKIKERPVILCIPDLEDPYPVWKRVLREYFSKDREEYELLIYIQSNTLPEKYNELIKVLEQYESCKSYVTIQDVPVEDERSLFKNIDYFITTRSNSIVRWSGYADYYNVTMISGVDWPIFDKLDKKQ